MPTKTTPTGVEYEIDGKKFTWHPEDDDGERGNLEPVVIPLRLKMKLALAFADEQGDMDAKAMKGLLEALVPNQADALGEMDVNDFQACFATWQAEYNALTGATLGE